MSGNQHTPPPPNPLRAPTEGWSGEGTVCGTLVTRREAMQHGLAGAAGVLLAGGLNISAWAATQSPGRATTAKAKAVIQIWMWGGPSHLDTFDPKPEAGNDYCGPLNHPIATSVDGLVISEL